MGYPWLCSDCKWLNPNETNRWGDYWCTSKRIWVAGDSKSCSNSFDNKGKSLYGTGSGLGCYLTTAMVEVLDLPDDTFCLEVLRRYRDTYLAASEDGIEVLKDYDIVGPEIAEKIKNDENSFNVATTMYYYYISPAVENIINGYNETALEIYENMTLDLMDHYDIDYSKLKAKDYENRGIARVRKPMFKNEKDS